MVIERPRSVSGLTSMPVKGSWVSFGGAGAVTGVTAGTAVNGNEQEADVWTVTLRPATFRHGDGPISASAWTTPQKPAGNATDTPTGEPLTVAVPGTVAVPTTLPVTGSLTKSIHLQSGRRGGHPWMGRVSVTLSEENEINGDRPATPPDATPPGRKTKGAVPI